MVEDPCFKVSPQAIARGIEDLLDENERLNNIINELEKWFKEMSEYNGLGGSDERFYYQGCLNYLQELKENK